MPKQENTAIDLLHRYSPRAQAPRPRPAPQGMSPSGPRIPALPRRRAPAATPQQVPLHAYAADYDEDAATTVDPPAGWAAHPAMQPTPPPLPPPPAQPAVQLIRPEYPAPHQPPAYYQAPYPDHLDTMRVRELPIAADRSLGSEVLDWVAKLWMPFVAVGVIAMTLGVYRLVTHTTEPPAITSEPAISMAAQPVAQPVAAETAEPVAADEHGVPKESVWQPTKAQPTLAPRVVSSSNRSSASSCASRPTSIVGCELTANGTGRR